MFAELSRKENHVVSISLAGYETSTLTLERKISGWLWGNIVFGGLIGLAVDSATGGMYRLEPESLAATLTRAGSAARGDGDTGLYIVTVMQPHADWQKIGQLQPE